MKDGRKNNGGARSGAGRKSRAEEGKLSEKLSHLDEESIKKLGEAVKAGERWAITIYFAYMYGKPVERKEISGPEGNTPIIIDLNKYM